MAENSKIEWTDHTFNPWRGCLKVHEGCAHCYAETMSKRNPSTLGIWGSDGKRVVAAESGWDQPLKWNRDARKDGDRRRVFCASLADVFETWHGPIYDTHGRQLFTINSDEWFTEPEWPQCRPLTLDDVRRRLFSLIDATPHLDWLLLTKRPENIQRMWPDYFPGGYLAEAGLMNQPGPRPNVWLGTSISLQEHADKQIPELLKCRDMAPVLFLSIEPLLGPINLIQTLTGIASDETWTEAHEWAGDCDLCGGEGFRELQDAPDEWGEDCLSERNRLIPCKGCRERDQDIRVHIARGMGLNWVIAGCESGPKRRHSEQAWFESLAVQCRMAGIPFFMKQMEIDGKVCTDITRFPTSLQIREFPRTEAIMA